MWTATTTTQVHWSVTARSPSTGTRTLLLLTDRACNVKSPMYKNKPQALHPRRLAVFLQNSTIYLSLKAHYTAIPFCSSIILRIVSSTPFSSFDFVMKLADCFVFSQA